MQMTFKKTSQEGGKFWNFKFLILVLRTLWLYLMCAFTFWGMFLCFVNNSVPIFNVGTSKCTTHMNGFHMAQPKKQKLYSKIPDFRLYYPKLHQTKSKFLHDRKIIMQSNRIHRPKQQIKKLEQNRLYSPFSWTQTLFRKLVFNYTDNFNV